MVHLDSVSLRAPVTNTPILSALSFSIANGDRVAVIGPSGCGKSSLFEMLIGSFSASSGTLKISGDEFGRGDCPKSVGYLPQNSLELLIPWLTSRENLRLVGRLRVKEQEAAPFSVDELFDRIKLTDRQSKYPLVLSGGERRRLAFAMVLSFSPQLILLDEPFTGVDLDLRFRLWDLLSEYRERRRTKPTMLLVTHFLEEAAILCDYVIFLKHGNNGTVLQRIGRPRNSFTGDWTADPSSIYQNRSQGGYLSYLDNEFKTATNP